MASFASYPELARLSRDEQVRAVNVQLAAQRLDTNWFRDHPQRWAYVRRSLAFEVAQPEPDREYFSAVVLLPSGQMLKRYFFSTVGSIPENPSDEYAVLAVAACLEHRDGEPVEQTILRTFGKMIAASPAAERRCCD